MATVSLTVYDILSVKE